MARMRYGENPHLEAEANEILRQSMAGVTAHSAKKDILTPWKEKDRRRREVFTGSGVADANLRRGQFNRVANPSKPYLNSVEGHARPVRTPTAQPDRTLSLRQFVEGSD